jgi:hypothetical protein
MYTVSMESIDRLVLIENITESQFNQLRADYPETLSCPCSNTALAYKKFVINEVEMSPICSSAFVNLSWIRSLHIPTASAYLPMDFRASAEAQVSSWIFLINHGITYRDRSEVLRHNDWQNSEMSVSRLLLKLLSHVY